MTGLPVMLAILATLSSDPQSHGSNHKKFQDTLSQYALGANLADGTGRALTEDKVSLQLILVGGSGDSNFHEITENSGNWHGREIRLYLAEKNHIYGYIRPANDCPLSRIETYLNGNLWETTDFEDGAVSAHQPFPIHVYSHLGLSVYDPQNFPQVAQPIEFSYVSGRTRVYPARLLSWQIADITHKVVCTDGRLGSLSYKIAVVQ